MTTEHYEGLILQGDLLGIVNSSKYWMRLKRNKIQKPEKGQALWSDSDNLAQTGEWG